MTRLIVPIVGSHFHPPAKQLLAGLPSGVALTLQAEPDNPYDEHAVLVHLDVANIPPAGFGRISIELDGTGSDIDSLLAEGVIVLGHCAASGGKPIAKLQVGCADKLSGTLEVGALLEHEHPDNVKCSLMFLADGSPAIEVSA